MENDFENERILESMKAGLTRMKPDTNKNSEWMRNGWRVHHCVLHLAIIYKITTLMHTDSRNGMLKPPLKRFTC